jgi:hypothetical protein
LHWLQVGLAARHRVTLNHAFARHHTLPSQSLLVALAAGWLGSSASCDFARHVAERHGMLHHLLFRDVSGMALIGCVGKITTKLSDHNSKVIKASNSKTRKA